MKKTFFILVVLGILGIGGFYAYKNYYCKFVSCGQESSKEKKVDVRSFAECVAGGFLTSEASPKTCSAGGQTFTEDVTPSILQSGISGQVTLGPTCPIVHKPSSAECADKPFETQLAITSKDGKTSKFVKSNKDGLFRQDLEPGDYIISSQQSRNSPPTMESQEFTVRADEYTRLLLKFDSGIR